MIGMRVGGVMACVKVSVLNLRRRFMTSTFRLYRVVGVSGYGGQEVLHILGLGCCRPEVIRALDVCGTSLVIAMHRLK